MVALLYARRAKTVRSAASAGEPLVAAERDLGPDARAGLGWALDAEPSLQRLHAGRQPAQARPARGVRAADAVVHDLDAGDAVAPADAHLDRRGVRVLRDVRQRLGDDVVRRRLDRRRGALRAL